MQQNAKIQHYENIVDWQILHLRNNDLSTEIIT
jgi:hypothetical protein